MLCTIGSYLSSGNKIVYLSRINNLNSNIKHKTYKNRGNQGGDTEDNLTGTKSVSLWGAPGSGDGKESWFARQPCCGV